MEQVVSTSPPRSARLWIAVGIFGIGTLTAAMLTRQPIRESAVTLASVINALTVLGVALMMAPLSPYPRWSHWTASAVLAGWVLVGPALAPDPQTWRTDIRPNLWFMPWVLLTFAGMPSRARGACATVGRRAGWMLVLCCVVMGA